MKVLAVISNYGTSNSHFLQKVLRELRSMPHEVDIVILSESPKDFGPEIQVRVGLPSNDPWTLPFAHKQVFAENVDNYDLFIYDEDDILITERHLDAFLDATKVLREDEIAGFMRYELDAQGRCHFCDVHSQFHWDARLTCRRGGHVFGFFTNEHAGCFFLTQAQLKRAIASGGFLVPPHRNLYELPETAATDPYTQCGFRKMISLTNFEDFAVHHMSNRYIGWLGLERSEFYKQISVLTSLNGETTQYLPLFEVQAKQLGSKCSKSYYEPFDAKLASLIPLDTRSVLSIGCGWGVTEEAILKSGREVTAIPLDSIIASLPEEKGIRVIRESLQEAPKRLHGEQFDCILFSDGLHLIADPVLLLKDFGSLLSENGCFVASVPNLVRPTILLRAALGQRVYRDFSTSYDAMGFHLTNRRTLAGWLEKSGFTLVQSDYDIPAKAEFADRLSLGLMRPLVGTRLNFRASKN
jgi:SAM-dependent methyltransferase